MCLYDEDKKILFSRDHIPFDITPNISYWEGHEALEEYLKSLDKIYELDMEITLPGIEALREISEEGFLKLENII